MNTTSFKYYTLAITSLATSLSAYSKEFAKSKQPNIIVIYTDQQRYDTIHRLGNEVVKTPNLDRMIDDGMAFTHSFTSSPVSVAARWGLHTGMYSTSHGAYSNHHNAFDRPEKSLPNILKDNGYQTILIGKNHSFLDKSDMDIIKGTPEFKHYPEDGRSAKNAMPWSVEDDPEVINTNRAIDYLSDNDDDRPKFIWLSYLYPHTPYMCPEPYFSMYNDIEIPDPVVEPEGLKAAGKPFRQQFHQTNNNILLPYDYETTMRMKHTYYGMITMIDAQIGRLLDHIDKMGESENTIIIFTSDHGDYMGDHGMNTKSPALYDCLVRVPLIFRWSGVIKDNTICDDLVSQVDIMPTLFDILGIEIPEQVQGVSLKNRLVGDKNYKPRKYVFAEYGIPGKPFSEDDLNERMADWRTKCLTWTSGMPWEGNPVSLAGRFRMIRSHRYKMIEEIGGTNELYDLQNDPNELTNLYGDKNYSKIVSEMTKALHKWKSNLPGIDKDNEDFAETSYMEYLKRRAI